MDRSGPQVLLFDLGNTLLVGSVPIIADRCRRLLDLSANADEINSDEFVAYATDIDEHAWATRDQSAIEYTTRAWLRLLLDEYQLVFKQTLDEVERDLYFHLDDSRPTDGVRQAIEKLYAMNIKMGVISNHLFGSAILREHLSRHNLSRYFELVMSSADYGLKKPSPVMFQSCLRRLKTRPDNVWFVGDSVKHDIEGAKAAGIHPVLYDPRADSAKTAGEFDVIQNWDDLLVLIESASS